MFAHFFSSKWKPFVVAETSGSSGCASMFMRGLECERHEKNGKVRFRGDFGPLFLSWLDNHWKDNGNDPTRMIAGSPWRWKVQIPEYKTFDLEVSYSSGNSSKQMFSDTLDAAIQALEKQRI
jgi:hypothetical protein